MLQRKAKIRATEMSSTNVKHSYVTWRCLGPVRHLQDVEHIGCSCFMFIGLKWK